MPRTTATDGNGGEEKSALEAALDKIETIKGSYREAIRGLNDLAETLRDAKLKAAQPRSCQTIREVLPAFVDEMVRIGEIRKSTAKG